MIKTYEFYYDAGHSWLEVDFNEIASFNIQDQISHYSYRKLGTNKCFLEEDCDAGIFLNELTKSGKQFKIKEVDHGRNSVIRNMTKFYK